MSYDHPPIAPPDAPTAVYGDASASPAHAKPRRRRRLRWWLVRWAWYLALIYGVWCGAVYLMQDRLLFQRGLAGKPPSTLIPRGVEQWWLDIPKDEKGVSPGRVEAWFFPGKDRGAESPGPAVMLFHGNAERIDQWIDIAREYQERGVSALLMEYRGYGNSAGEPTQEGILRDSIAFHTRLCDRFEVASGKVFFQGRSLGGGVACALAARREPAALILECTFTSVASFAASYGVPQRLVKHPFRNDETLLGVTAPLLLAHGRDDTVVPITHSMTLARVRPDSIFVELPAGHLDFPGDRPLYDKEKSRFLRRLGLIP